MGAAGPGPRTHLLSPLRPRCLLPCPEPRAAAVCGHGALCRGPCRRPPLRRLGSSHSPSTDRTARPRMAPRRAHSITKPPPSGHLLVPSPHYAERKGERFQCFSDGNDLLRSSHDPVSSSVTACVPNVGYFTRENHHDSSTLNRTRAALHTRGSPAAADFWHGLLFSRAENPVSPSPTFLPPVSSWDQPSAVLFIYRVLSLLPLKGNLYRPICVCVYCRQSCLDERSRRFHFF